MKVVVTVLGVDRVGITAKVSTALAAHDVNILSINQTILDGFFNMIMVCELNEHTTALGTVQEALMAAGQTLGVEVRVQHADIFHNMHRI